MLYQGIKGKNFLVKLSLYNTIHLYHNPFLWIKNIALYIKALHCIEVSDGWHFKEVMHYIFFIPRRDIVLALFIHLSVCPHFCPSGTISQYLFVSFDAFLV